MSPVLPHIAINGRFLTQATTGVQRFAVEATKAIDRLIDGGEYAALEGRIEIVAPRSARDFPLRHIPLRRCGRFNGYFWEQVEFPLHARNRLLLNMCMLGPVMMRHQIVVVHDAAVRALPANFSKLFRLAYGFLVPRLCRRADRIVTVSEFSRREIGKWYGADVGKVRVSYVGADHLAAVGADQTIIERLGLSGRTFFLGVGGGGARNKNLETAVAGFMKADLPETLMVLTGAHHAWVFGHSIDVTSERVRRAGYVSDSELRALYEHALAIVFPSYYEGFGLPPLEAMLCGCPGIISDQQALVEICGDVALKCSANDSDEIARLMRLIHDDPERRAAMVAAGRVHAARFTWESTARVLLDLCLSQAKQNDRSRASVTLAPETNATA
jgi:glycosyltransferase involved in cell wall biosynthesis